MKIISHIYNKFRNLQMNLKITIIWLFVLIFSIITIGTVVYYEAAQVIDHQVNNNVNEILQQSTKYLDEKLKSILIQIHFLQTTESFTESLIDIFNNEDVDYNLQYSRIQPLLTQIKSRDEYIKSIQVITPRGNFYDSFLGFKREEESYIKDLYKNKQANGLVYWGNNEDITDHSSSSIPVIMNITIDNEKANIDKKNSFFLLDLSKDTFESYIEEMGRKIQGEIYIIDEENKIVFTNKTNEFLDIFYDRTFLNKLDEIDNNKSFMFKEKYNMLINISDFHINNWKMVSVQRQDIILKDLSFIKAITLISGFILLISAFLFSTFMAGNITKPMKRLQRIMESAPNEDFNIRFNSKYYDEIGELGRSFDAMSDKIQSLIGELKLEHEHIKEEQLLKRKAEMRALQAQINPHFLYNALDSIYWRSMMKGNEEVGEMAIALADLFRIGLNKGKEVTTVYKEVQHVKNYLLIQKIIYEDKFNYYFNINEEAYEYETLKLILQPLVENSILHGFNEMNETGIIKINVSQDLDKVCIEVIDNGCGFSDKNMLDSFKHIDKNYKGYALKNVFQRLELHYGELCEFTIHSTPYVETMISIRIPKIKIM
ncbi:sensor histidine kinase [Clostridium sp. DL1XJH146]